MGSWPFVFGSLILLIMYVCFSSTLKVFLLRLKYNKLDLKSKNTGEAIIHHMGELGLVILLFEKLESSTKIPPNPHLILESITIWFWTFFQAYISILFAIAYLYTYGKLALILFNRGIKLRKILIILFASIMTFLAFVQLI